MNELEQYNPEMLDKQFLIAISKCDMLDDELKTAISAELRKMCRMFLSRPVTQSGLAGAERHTLGCADC